MRTARLIRASQASKVCWCMSMPITTTFSTKASNASPSPTSTDSIRSRTSPRAATTCGWKSAPCRRAPPRRTISTAGTTTRPPAPWLSARTPRTWTSATAPTPPSATSCGTTWMPTVFRIPANPESPACASMPTSTATAASMPQASRPQSQTPTVFTRSEACCREPTPRGSTPRPCRLAWSRPSMPWARSITPPRSLSVPPRRARTSTSATPCRSPSVISSGTIPMPTASRMPVKMASPA